MQQCFSADASDGDVDISRDTVFRAVPDQIDIGLTESVDKNAFPSGTVKIYAQIDLQAPAE